jgi:general secretion pathway protein G
MDAIESISRYRKVALLNSLAAPGLLVVIVAAGSLGAPRWIWLPAVFVLAALAWCSVAAHYFFISKSRDDNWASINTFLYGSLRLGRMVNLGIAILATLPCVFSVPLFLDRMAEREHPNICQAKEEVMQLCVAADLYLEQHGDYPPSLANLANLPESGSQQLWEGGLPIDPWGNPYVYLRDEATGCVAVMSGGWDGEQTGTNISSRVSACEHSYDFPPYGESHVPYVYVLQYGYGLLTLGAVAWFAWIAKDTIQSRRSGKGHRWSGLLGHGTRHPAKFISLSMLVTVIAMACSWARLYYEMQLYDVICGF